MSTQTYIPEVLWAQRSSSVDAEKNFLYVTLVVPDAAPEKSELKITPTSVSFKGYSATLKRTFDVTLELYAEIDEAASKANHTSRSIELKLIKKDLKEEYWPRLLKDSKKVHFLKTDFDKWVDEDEQNDAPEEDFSQFGDMGGMGGGMGGGMPGMGGMGGMPGMGGMGGMPGMGGDFSGIDFSKLGGGEGFGADGDDDDAEDDDEDEMPPLEGDDAAPAAAAETGKVVEVVEDDAKPTAAA